MYGDFYGSVSPLTIMVALRQFMVERSVAIDKKNQEKREEEMEESRKNAITWEEYCKQRDIRRQEPSLLSFQKQYQSHSLQPVLMNKKEGYNKLVLASAHKIVENPHGYNDAFLQAAAENFRIKYGYTAEDYIKEFDKD